VPARAQGAPPPATVLVRYGFDDDSVAAGPDTFAVFRAAHGRVALSTAFRLSGYRSVEISDVAGNGDFSELQGYFPEQRTGRVFAHFALLTARPEEELNLALAGPRRFQLGKDGIAFWLATREGRWVHTSDSIPKKLAPVRAFVWYTIDLAYDVERGRYDLVIREEGRAEPVVSLRDQPGAASQAASAVDLFSFISDPTEDASEVTYYVDDVMIATSREVAVPPLIAPGRRKLFVDAFDEFRRAEDARPQCLPPVSLADLGVEGRDAGALDGVLTGTAKVAPTSSAGVRAAAEWGAGCAALADGQAAPALAHFDHAATLAPGARLYRLSGALALVALGRPARAEERLAALRSAWPDDARFVVVAAMAAGARGDLPAAREAVRSAAEAGDAAAAERYYLALLWDGRWREAHEWALGWARRSPAGTAAAAQWMERAGDAAFRLRSLEEAKELYESAVTVATRSSLILKLSDVAFLAGDLESERRYRERLYGSLTEE
jgi:tetratricopeptide (TPR) repeat protein